jgi:dihydroorotase
MKLIKSATVIDKNSKWNGQQVDLLIINGKIGKIAKSIKAGEAMVIESNNLCISPSWVDIGTQLSEPGFEHRETIKQTAMCARRGGFAHLACLPNTQPSIDNKASIDFIIQKGKENKTNIIPIGALSKGCNGEELSEILDLNHQGCSVFSDGNNYSVSSGLLKRGLLYIKQFNGSILTSALDKELANHGLIHEGDISLKLGIKAISSMAEYAEISRQIMIAEYTQSKLCIHNISTKEGLRLIQQAKKNSDLITTTVSYLNLIATDNSLETFDTNYKVLPPLRSNSDKNALTKGLNSGDIQAITSNHKPYDVEAKDLEFEYAQFGSSGLETVFAGLITFNKKLDLEAIIYALSIGPRKILSLPIPAVEEGQRIDYTLFDPEEEWQFSSTHSASKNNPLLGKNLKGKVIDLLV